MDLSACVCVDVDDVCLCLDEDASGDDEDVVTRHGLKKQSQLIIDAKTRRGRPGKRKKKGAAK